MLGPMYAQFSIHPVKRIGNISAAFRRGLHFLKRIAVASCVDRVSVDKANLGLQFLQRIDIE